MIIYIKDTYFFFLKKIVDYKYALKRVIQFIKDENKDTNFNIDIVIYFFIKWND